MENKRSQHGKFSQQNGQRSRFSEQRSQQSRPSQPSSPQNLGNINYEEEGWKNRYYEIKFEAKTDEDRERIRSDVVLKYTEGICWVMHYYYESVCSWQWFYPYNYAPFASDFHDTKISTIQFTLGEPFKPFDQLMAVLPAASAHALPPAYQKLMTDPSSPLALFYPKDFELDLNDKRFSWQAICKLPFIEEFLLLSEIAKLDQKLTEPESRRNSLGSSVLFLHSSHPLAEDISSLYPALTDITQSTKHEINPKLSDGMNGYVLIPEKLALPEKIESPITCMREITGNLVLSFLYEFPPFHPHISGLPMGVELPIKSVSTKDIQPTPCLWHERSSAVGRLHSVSAIPHSISGPRLLKAARRLVLTWLIEARQGVKRPRPKATEDEQEVKRPRAEATEDGGTQTCGALTKSQRKNRKKKAKRDGTYIVTMDFLMNASSTQVDSIVGEAPVKGSDEGEPVSVINVKDAIDTGAECKPEKKLRRAKRKEKLDGVYSNKNDVGMTSSTVTQTPITTALIPNSGDSTFASPIVSSIQTSAEKNSIVKDDDGCKAVPENNVKEAVDVSGNATNGIEGETGSDCKSKKKLRRAKRKAKLDGVYRNKNDVGMTSSTVMQTDLVSDTSSFQTDVHKNSIDGESVECKIPEAQDVDEGKENNVPGAIDGGTKGNAVLPQDRAYHSGEGNVVQEKDVREAIEGGVTETSVNTGIARSDCKSEKKPKRRKKKAELAGIDGEALDISGTETKGIKGETGADCKPKKISRWAKRKEKLAGIDNVKNDIGMTSLTVMQTDSVLNFGDTTFASPGESSIQTGAHENSIDGEAVERIILKAQDVARLPVLTQDPVKDNDEGKVVPEKNVPLAIDGRTEGMAVLSQDPINHNDEGNVVQEKDVREATEIGGTGTSGNTGIAGSDYNLEEKPKRRKKKANLTDTNSSHNDVALTGSTVTQIPIATDFASLIASSIHTSIDQSSVEGEAENRVILIVEDLEKRSESEEVRPVVSQDLVKDSYDVLVVRKSNVKEAIVGETETTVNTGVAESGKKGRWIKRKAVLPGVDENNNDSGKTSSTLISNSGDTSAQIVSDFEKGSLGEESRPVLTQDPVKDNAEGNIVAENNVGEAIIGGTETTVDTGVAESGKKRRWIKRKAIRPSVDDYNNDSGPMSSTLISNLGHTNAQIVSDFEKGSLAEKSRPVLTQDPVKDNAEGKIVSENNVGEAMDVGATKISVNTGIAESGKKRRWIKRKAVIPSVDDNNNDLGTTNSSLISNSGHTNAQIVADFEKGSLAEESIPVLTQDPVKDNAEGNIVAENNVGEAVIGGTETSVNTGVADSGKKRRWIKKKAVRPSVNDNNNDSATTSSTLISNSGL